MQRKVVDAFLAASRNGDFAALLNLLDPDVTVRADAAAAAPGTATRLRGARQVARQALAFSRRAKDAQSGFVNGLPAILVTPRGRLVMVITFTITSGKIVAIDVIADPERLSQLIIESASCHLVSVTRSGREHNHTVMASGESSFPWPW